MSIKYFGPNTPFLGFEFNRKHNPSLPVSSSQPTATPNHIKGCSVSLTQPPSFTEPFPKIDLSQRERPSVERGSKGQSQSGGSTLHGYAIWPKLFFF